MNREPGGFRIGDAFGVPVLLAPSFVILAATSLFWAIRANSTPELVERAVLLIPGLASLLAHELAHARAAVSLGIPVRRIVLTWFGGFAEFWVSPTRGWREAAIAAAGPVANLAIAALCLLIANVLGLTGFLSGDSYYIASSPGSIDLTLSPAAAGSVGRIVAGLYWFNLALGLFNLLPGLPLDGGHILRACLSAWVSRGRAGWLAAWAGVATGICMIASAFIFENLWLLFAGGLVFASAWSERRRMRYD